MDGYQLVRLRAILAALSAGAVAMIACYLVNGRLIEWTGLDLGSYARYVAPAVEESVKATYPFLLISHGRIGFTVDTLVLGFAVGAGFGLLENLILIQQAPDTPSAVWALRGFGTAVMHGGATAVFAVVARTRDEGGSTRLHWSIPAGLGLAMVLHSLYNHFLVSTTGTVLGLVVLLPLAVAAAFRYGEAETDRWLSLGFDTDAELLFLLRSGEMSSTPLGTYLHSLRRRFRPEMVVDLLCLLRLETELALQAKGLLLMRKGGFTPPAPAGIEKKLAELRYLERTVGPIGRLALGPFLRRRKRSRWQHHLLKRG